MSVLSCIKCALIVNFNSYKFIVKKTVLTVQIIIFMKKKGYLKRICLNTRLFLALEKYTFFDVLIKARKVLDYKINFSVIRY